MIAFGAVIPLLVYEDIAAAHDFLVNVFGFTAGGISRGEDGRAVHGEVLIGTTPIWLHRVTEEHALASPLPAVRSNGLVVYVDNVDAHYEQVRAAGAYIVSEPVDQPYGQREYASRDSEGHRWWFAMPVVSNANG